MDGLNIPVANRFVRWLVARHDVLVRKGFSKRENKKTKGLRWGWMLNTGAGPFGRWKRGRRSRVSMLRPRGLVRSLALCRCHLCRLFWPGVSTVERNSAAFKSQQTETRRPGRSPTGSGDATGATPETAGSRSSPSGDDRWCQAMSRRTAGW